MAVAQVAHSIWLLRGTRHVGPVRRWLSYSHCPSAWSSWARHRILESQFAVQQSGSTNSWLAGMLAGLNERMCEKALALLEGKFSVKAWGSWIRLASLRQPALPLEVSLVPCHTQTLLNSACLAWRPFRSSSTKVEMFPAQRVSLGAAKFTSHKSSYAKRFISGPNFATPNKTTLVPFWYI